MEELRLKKSGRPRTASLRTRGGGRGQKGEDLIALTRSPIDLIAVVWRGSSDGLL